MDGQDIQRVSPGGALNAENYQTYEMTKANDDVIGGDNIAQIRSYAAYARAQAQAIYKTIAATNGIDDVAAIKAEAIETEQTFAKVSVYADQRIGELLRELPTKAGQRNDLTSMDAPKEVTKGQAVKSAGIDTHTAYDLQKLAANPEVVQAVIDKATEEGRVVSRSQVLKAIEERDKARREVAQANETHKREIASLKRQKDELAKKANYPAETKVVEHTVEVVPSDYEQTKKRVRDLEHEVKVTNKTYQSMREQLNSTRQELSKARDLLGMSERVHDIRRDVQYLISATNGYVRQYGGLTWTAQSLAEVDEPTREELTKAARNLATFAAALVNSLESIDG